MPVGEVFLSAFLSVLFDRLARGFFNFLPQVGIKKNLVKWRKMLPTILAVLNDAEEKQTTNRAVKIWLQDLRDLSYDMEDILDEFATEALRRKLKAEHQAAGTSKVWNLVSSSFANLTFNMRSEINEVTSRLQYLSEDISKLGLLEKLMGEGGISTHVRQRPASTCLPNERGIVGRDEDKKNILESVLRDMESSDVNFCVLPIIGMGGVGKTTFARLLYNDKELMDKFDAKAWVCVSVEFDVMRITKALLESITSQSCDLKELNQVQVKLDEALKGKKFFIVLDDIWNKNYGDWDALRSPFRAGAPGSRIIVTTRDEDVALMMGTYGYCYDLQPLSDDECWSVFVQHAFDKGMGELQNLESKFREKAVEKCKGLPLAARTLGGLLHSKQKDYEWDDVLNSRLWDLSHDECDILPVLRLSYYHLPSHLKSCFAYCAIFPKDYEFEEEELVLLWMAEGLIHSTDEDKQMKDIGYEYLDDLYSRSMFQPLNEDSFRFRMHDLVNDLAQWAAGETCFRLEDEMGANRSSKISQKARHASFVRGIFVGFEKFEDFSAARHLRTFLSISDDDSPCGFLTNKVLDLLPKLRYLRSLSLSGYVINQLPDSINKLKHLRYLDLSLTLIRSLPDSVCSLYNLQTLKLKGCRLLQKLPTKMEELINLHHLDITNANLIKEMPLGIYKLTNLSALSDFVVGKHSGSEIKELKSLKFLQGSLRISSLENVIDARDAREANLNDKNLVELFLEWGSEFNDLRHEGVSRDVLDMLQPHKALDQLTISGYLGSRFPAWIGDPKFSDMVVLRLENCKKCESLPPLGQLPSLKDLSIVGMHAVKSIGPEFFGESITKPFQSLEILHFENMQKWENWIPCLVNQEEFLCLHELSIAGCPKLSGKLPTRLPSLEKLVISQCEQFFVSIPSLPALCNVEIKGCKEVVNRSSVNFNSLKSMEVSNISKLKYLTEEYAQGMTKVEKLLIVGCKEMTSLWQNNKMGLQQLTSLRYLVIESCPQLVSLVAEEEVEEDQLRQSELESLMLNGCRSLEMLPEWLCSLKSLRWLHIEDCPRFDSFPEAGLPSMLREIWIKNCNSLAPLPEAVLHNSNCLQTLCIEGCDSLMSFGRGQLPTTLKALNIISCKNLQCLLDEGKTSSHSMMHEEIVNSNSSSLVVLLIRDCQSLVSLSSQGELPATLKTIYIQLCSQLVHLTPGGNLPLELQYLFIEGCSKLESIAERFHNNMSLRSIEIQKCENLKSLPDGIHSLSNLSEITIFDCSALLSFPKEGLPNINLKKLSVCNCEKLKDLPVGMHNLTSLQELEISNCPGIISFPKEGFPANLKSLRLTNLKICKPLFDWGLYRLNSLKYLKIIGGCPDVISFPYVETGMMLPVSLTSLVIGDFLSLKSLSSKGFQNLTLLEYLSINGCPKLKSFPNNGLPLSLLQLHVTDCTLLKQRCNKKDKGKEWLKIAHIPCVFVDKRSAFDSGLVSQYFSFMSRIDTVAYQVVGQRTV